MQKMLRFIVGLIVVIIVLPVLLLAALYITVDFDGIKKDIIQQASTTLGRDIALDGPIGIGFDNGISLNISDVRMGNPEGFEQKDFVKAGKISVALNWKALADRTINIQKIVVKDAALHIITNKAGRSNMVFPSVAQVEAKPEETTQSAASKDAFKIDRVDLNSIEIVQTTIHQIDERKDSKQELFFEKANITAPFDGALNVGAAGRHNTIPFTVELTVPAGMKALMDGKPADIDLKADYAGKSYAIKANYAASGTSFTLNTIQAAMMGMQWKGDLTVRIDGMVPMIKGTLSSPEINLVSLGKQAQRGSKKQHAIIQPLVMHGRQAANMIVAEHAAPDFKALRAVNTNIALDIGKLVFAEGKALDNVKTNLVLSNGRLRLEPLHATFLNVAYKGLLDFNASAATPVTRIVLTGENIDFVALASAFNSKSPLAANGDLDLDITGQGATPDAFKQSLSGTIQMTAGKGALDMGSSGAAGIALIKMLYPKTQASQQQNINCAVVRFNAENGVLRAKGMLFDSPLAAVAGEGSIDLVQDQVNLLFRHAVKDQQVGGLLNVPIKATGSLASMNFMPDESAVAQKVIGALTGGGAVSTGVPRVDPNAKDVRGSACVAAINNPQPIMLQQMTPKEAVKATINQAKDVIKNLGKPDEALDKLKGLFR